MSILPFMFNKFNKTTKTKHGVNWAPEKSQVSQNFIVFAEVK